MEFNVRITFLCQTKEFIQVFAQKDAQNLVNFERAWQVYSERDAPVSPLQLTPNLRCCALLDGKFYRVDVKHIEGEIAFVQSIDYGFKCSVNYREIRLFDPNDKNKDLLPYAVEYYVAGIVVVGQLTNEELTYMRNTVANHSFYVHIDRTNTCTRTHLATFYKDSNQPGAHATDLKKDWQYVEKVREIAIGEQDVKLSNYYKDYITPDIIYHHRERAPPPISYMDTPPAAPPHTPSPVPLTRHAPAPAAIHMYPNNPPPSLTPTPSSYGQFAFQHPPMASIPGGRSNHAAVVDNSCSLPCYAPHKVLRAKKTYNVTVSDATSGPFLFSILIAEDAESLKQITDLIQRLDKVTMKIPYYSGRPCIAFHPIEKVYARAIILSEGDRYVNVEFIDYGNIEKVNLRELFEMPSQGLTIKRLSQKFRLAQLPQIKPNCEDYRIFIDAFKEVVTDRELNLTVTDTEDGCSQNCELYDKATTKSIKILINDLLKKVNAVTYIADSLPSVGTTLPVYISHVDNAKRFYVQKKEQEDLCGTLQEKLQVAGRVAECLRQVTPSAPCITMFSGDELWYRARIVKGVDATSMSVFFVDYGNSDIVKIANLKELPRELAKIPTLAIECSLAETSRPDVEAKLHELTNDDTVTATVVSTAEGALRVKILHAGVDITTVKPIPDPQHEVLKTFSPPLPAPAEASMKPSNTRRQESSHRSTPGRSTIRDRFARRSDHDRRSLTEPYEACGVRHSRPSGNRNAQPKSYGSGRFSHKESETHETLQNNHQDANNGYEAKSHGVCNRYPNKDKEVGDEKNNWREEGRRDRKFGKDDGFSRGKRDEFSDAKSFGGDSGGFKKFGDAGGRPERPDRPMRTPVRFDERPPPGTDWSEPTIEPGTEQDVMVTLFLSPADFHVQTSTEKAAFVSLMENIQSDYHLKFSFKKDQQPQVSDIAIAKFSEDRVLYRAQVIEADPMTVRFVDYGNTEVITDDRNIYPVMNKLLNLPKQAVRCRLANVQPVGDAWSPDAGPFFDKENMKCSFVSVDEDGVYVVSLSCEGEVVAQQLRAAGLAMPAGDAQSAPALVAQIDSNLLLGEFASFKVPYIEGVDKFFVHPDSASVELVQSLVADYVVKSHKPLTLPEDLTGAWCIAGPTPEVRYRARILEPSETGFWIEFVDFGDSADVLLADMVEISEELKSYPPQAVECGLRGDTSQVTDEAQDKFKADFESKSVLLHFDSIKNNRLLVTVFDEERSAIVVEGVVNDSQAVVPPYLSLPLPSSLMSLDVLDFATHTTCLVTLPGISPIDLTAGMPENTDGTVLEVGSKCAVKCSDGTWRRSVRPEEGAQCYMVDLGRSELCTEFRPLPAEYASVPAAIRVVQFTWPELGTHSFKIARNDSNFTISPIEKTAFVVHVESSSDLYVNPESLTNKIAEVVDALSASQPSQDSLQVEFFAAKFPDDEAWYRATPLSMTEPLHVRFIDYGNCAHVTEVCPLSPQLLACPPMAMHVKFEAGLPESAHDELSNMLLASELPFKLVEENDQIVDLTQGELSVADKMLQRLPLKPGMVVYICSVEELTCFYVNRHQETEVLEMISAALLAHGPSYTPVTNPVEGQLLAAKYKDDGVFYRARVVGDQVFFVDHGNCSDLDEVTELPEELSVIPPCAVPISLESPGREWNEADLGVLLNLQSVPLTIIEATWCKYKYIVKLSEGGEVLTLPEVQDTEQVVDVRPVSNWANDTQSETDDHKSACAAALGNVTDEQKQEMTLDSPRSDDEKILPSGSQALRIGMAVMEDLVTEVTRASTPNPTVEDMGPSVTDASTPNPLVDQLQMEIECITLDETLTEVKEEYIEEDTVPNLENEQESLLDQEQLLQVSEETLQDSVPEQGSEEAVQDRVPEVGSEEVLPDSVPVLETNSVEVSLTKNAGLEANGIVDTILNDTLNSTFASHLSSDWNPENTTEDGTLEASQDCSMLSALESVEVNSSEDVCIRPEDVELDNTLGSTMSASEEGPVGAAASTVVIAETIPLNGNSSHRRSEIQNESIDSVSGELFLESQQKVKYDNGQNDEVKCCEKATQEATTVLTNGSRPKTPVDEKIVPGSICRGINYSAS